MPSRMISTHMRLRRLPIWSTPTRSNRPGQKPVRLTCDDVASSGPSDSHHDLPELTALLEIAVHIHHLVEGEGTVDDGLERACLQTLDDELDRGFAAGFITARERHVVRLDGRHLGDHFEHGQWGDTRGEQAVDVDDAAEGQR